MTERSLGYATFETALGVCGIAWSAVGITHVQLPESSVAATRARLARRCPLATEADEVVAVHRKVRDDIVALLCGARVDFADAVLDVTGVSAFDQRVHAVTRTVPAGETTTYGAIATRLGEGTIARAVGQSLGRNPFPLVVPCHRVVAAGQRYGGFSGAGGVATKLRILALEGAAIAKGPAQQSLFDR